MNLYTKYRSKNFSEVIGQHHVVKVLTSAIVHDRVAHAYLFSGPRGTGKTTIARLLAKALNCENRKEKEFESCNKCQSCKEIVTGSSMDIIEIDAASNRGIDEIRELREKVKFAPSGKKYKIFIIDEVHMLTREAFNALLKTLEEPPKHVVFILATTELHKVPDTIVSRTQQFDFKLHTLSDIIAQLTSIAKSEKIVIDPESIELIAQSAQGGLRDAISLLDQVANMGEKIDGAMTREILGLTNRGSLLKFISLISENNTKGLLDIIADVNDKGADFYQFIYEILEILRKILLFNCGYEKVLNDFTKEEQAQLKKLSKSIDNQKIVMYLEKFLQVQGETKNASIVQLPLEIAVFELTHAKDMKQEVVYDEETPEDDNTEIEVQEEVVIEKEELTNIKPASTVQKETPKIEKTKKTIKKNNANFDFASFSQKWPEILKTLIGSSLLNSLLRDAKPMAFENNTLFIGVPFAFYKDKLQDKKVSTTVNKLLEKYLDDSMLVKFQVDPSLIKQMPKHDPSTSSPRDALSMDASEIFG